jgi:hypothetical protein
MTPERAGVTLDAFYRIERAGAARLSDGGGPFGFDITIALLVDDLIERYGCDAIAETGCFLGDTTVYLARRYATLPVYSCDTDAAHVGFTQARLAGCGNARVTCADSPSLVGVVCAAHERPLFYLDAHWGEQWPLPRELAAITAGVAVIHDFDIGHPRFSFDTYDGVACGPVLLAAVAGLPPMYFTPDPGASFPLPCLQTGRRAGTGITVIGLDTRPLEQHPWLQTRRVPAPAGRTA